MSHRNEGFVDPRKYWEVAQICDLIEKDRAKLLRFSEVLPYQSGHYHQVIPEGWDLATLKYLHHKINPILSWLDTPAIQTFSFSRLAPHTHIEPHEGYAGDIFRLHYGLKVPEGDQCYIRVGPETRSWKTGEFLMFSDLDNHEAWNNSDEERLVLIVDIPKWIIENIDPGDKR